MGLNCSHSKPSDYKTKPQSLVHQRSSWSVPKVETQEFLFYCSCCYSVKGASDLPGKKMLLLVSYSNYWSPKDINIAGARSVGSPKGLQVTYQSFWSKAGVAGLSLELLVCNTGSLSSTGVAGFSVFLIYYSSFWSFTGVAELLRCMSKISSPT